MDYSWNSEVNKEETEPLKEYRNKPSDAKLEAFKLYQKMLKNLIRKAKITYFSQKFADCGKTTKKTWDVIKEAKQPSASP